MMRTLIIATTSVSAAILFSSGAFTQESRRGTALIPDFSGIWAHPSAPGFEPLPSGPGPVTNRVRRNGVRAYRAARTIEPLPAAWLDQLWVRTLQSAEIAPGPVKLR